MARQSWIRTLLQRGKLENIKQEMKLNNIDILGLCEMRWKESGDFNSDGFRVIFSGGNESQRGVGIILTKKMGNRVKEVRNIDDRLY